MIFRHRMRSLVAISRDAFRARDVDESIVARMMRCLSHCTNGRKLFFRAKEAFIASRNVVIYFDAEYVTFLGSADDLIRIASLEPIRADADVVAPILFVLRRGSRQVKTNQTYQTHSKFFLHRVPYFCAVRLVFRKDRLRILACPYKGVRPQLAPRSVSFEELRLRTGIELQTAFCG